MKKLLSFILPLALIIPLSACSKKQDEKDRKFAEQMAILEQLKAAAAAAEGKAPEKKAEAKVEKAPEKKAEPTKVEEPKKEEAAKVFAPLAAVKNYKITKDTSNGAYAAVYKLTLSDGSNVQDSVDINIPKDMVVSAGEVVTDPEGQEQGTYIKLTLANATNDTLYIPVSKLSIGTIDQLYLSLRLSMAEELSKESLPIILDEAFAYYDEERLENILEYINKQIHQNL